MAVVRPSRLAFGLGLGLLGSLALAACVTPSIPIPPPEPELMTFAVDVGAGVVSFSYDPEPNFSDAVVYIYNRDRGQGIITTARADGSVGPTAPFGAAVGENIAVTFETDETTVGACVQIRADGTATPFCTR